MSEAQDILQAVTDLLHQDASDAIADLLQETHPAEIAQLLESLPSDQRETVWPLIPPEAGGEILVHLNDELRNTLIQKMAPNELVAATESLDTDDLADILPEMPQPVIQELLLSMESHDRERLKAVLSYPEDTAGGLMDPDTIMVRADITLDVVIRYLRRRGDIPEGTDSLFVVDRDDRYLGLLPLTTLLTCEPVAKVAELMHRHVEGIQADTSAQDVAKLFEQRDLITAPVVDTDQQLLGRITIDDVVDVIRDTADHSLMSMAGLNEEDDMFSPVFTSARRRAIWLGVNLLTAFMASWVIGQFEGTIEKLVALAVLMPIVASMGGIAGTQTLTLVIRGMALGLVAESNSRRLLIKELLVALCNGLIWAAVIALVAGLWFQNTGLSLIIAAAIIINLIVAAISGAALPLLLKRLGADPALAGSVVLTTITDVIGFLSFLGLATLFLL